MRPNSALLKQRRKLRGWSQAFVADAAGLSRRTVQNIETDTGTVKASSIYALAEVLNVNQSDAVIANQDLIDNQKSFAVWPWRLFEFLGKRLLPHEHTFIRSRAEAESVVEKVWGCWQVHLSNVVKTKSVRRSAIGDRQMESERLYRTLPRHLGAKS